MLNIARRILLLLAVGLLFSCGGSDDAFVGGDGTVPPPGGETPVTPSSIQLISSSPSLDSAGSSSITLTAIVKDASNVMVQDATVSFVASSGNINIVRGTTDASGTAEAALSTQGDTANRAITVTATTGGLTTNITLQVTGTTISVSGPSSATVGAPVTLNITLRDSAGAGIANKTLSVTSSLNSVISPAAPVTGLNGQATVTVTPSAGGTDVITVSGEGATAKYSYSISTDSFTFTSPASSAEIQLGASQPVTACWRQNNTPVSGQPINFSATRGTLSAPNATTDGTGCATVNIQSNNAGPSVITATAATSGGPSAQLSIQFVATAVNSMTLQANPAVVTVNSSGGTTNQSEIIAAVLDPNNNPVKNKIINFTLTDTTGGSITTASATTDSFGRASTIYIAGQTQSAADGVRIDASVVGTSVTASVNLTVSGISAFVTLGTGNVVQKIGNTQYSVPYDVLVTDTNGAPVANQKVRLSLWPTRYYKGSYSWGGKYWEQIFSLRPAVNGGLNYCINEDVNRNGIAEFAAGPDIDVNNNGMLNPGNVATLSAGEVTTDASGFAHFGVVYSREYAQWVDVELTARTTVSGTEASKTVYFNLPIAADDVTNQQIAPPGSPSPFGASQSCASDAILYVDPVLLTTSTSGSITLALFENGIGVPNVAITPATISYLPTGSSMSVIATPCTTDNAGQCISNITVSGGNPGDSATIHYQGGPYTYIDVMVFHN